MFTKKCSMKKLLSVLLCVTGSTVFIACQKNHDLPAAEALQAEITTTTTGEVTMESATGCGQFRTQSQGGWGVRPVGENPGTYLHDHFATAFPTGLFVGCATGGYTVSFSSAQSVTEFLPAGGTAAQLNQNAINPAAKSIANVLIGQVSALAINVRFDYYDPNFGPAEENLGNLVISTGRFTGLSVTQFLEIANSVLGGCNNVFTPEEVNQTASMINANFIDGTIDAGFLTCPTVRFGER